MQREIVLAYAYAAGQIIGAIIRGVALGVFYGVLLGIGFAVLIAFAPLWVLAFAVFGGFRHAWRKW
jgi:hypothetical protein